MGGTGPPEEEVGMRGRKLLVVLFAAATALGCVRIDSGHRGVLWSFFGGTNLEDV